MSKKRKWFFLIPLSALVFGGPIALTSCSVDPATYFANNKPVTDPQLPDYSSGSSGSDSGSGSSFSGNADESPY